MKDKGFTLIELLAVIVVLAVIALIATPLVLNTIEKTKKGAAEASANTYIDGVETSLASYMLKNNGIGYTAGNYSVSTLKNALDVKVKGDAPSVGNICIGSNGTVTKASLKINNYVVSYDGKKTKTTDLTEVEQLTCEEVALVGDSILDKAKTLVYTDNTCKTDGSTYSYMGGCYLTGNPTNNYLWYNGFMWRIMGINSDNTVRLVTDENVSSLSYGNSTEIIYNNNEGFIHDWLNEYFYEKLNNTKLSIQNGAYFCSETTSSGSSTRETCADTSKVTTNVGILSLDEYNLSGAGNSYLNISQKFWTMTPSGASNAYYVEGNGKVTAGVASVLGIRPVINVSSTSIITSGNGTTTSFYVLEEDKTNNRAGTLSNIVTSGEYVNLEGKVYRVVSKDSTGVKLILDSYYEEPVGTIYTTTYGDNTTFTLNSGIGQKLNGDVLSWLGLVTSDKVVETTYYQGDAFNIASMNNTLKKTNGIEAKVGLIEIGEMLAGQSSTMLTKNYTMASNYANTRNYWTMNIYTAGTNAWRVCEQGNGYESVVTNDTRVIRPVIVVKNDLSITSGTGIWTSPYQI